METRSGQIYYQPEEYDYFTTRSGKRYKRDLSQKDPENHNNPVEVNVADETKSFKKWKQEVNKLVKKNIGTECDSLGDFPYYDCYVENMEPRQVYNKLLDRYIQEEQESFYQDFLNYKDDINTLLQEKFQTNITDIPDLPYYDSFCEGFCPQQMLNYIKEEFFV